MRVDSSLPVESENREIYLNTLHINLDKQYQAEKCWTVNCSGPVRNRMQETFNLGEQHYRIFAAAFSE